MTPPSAKLIIRDLGLQDYQPVWKAMQEYTAKRDETSNDELWCLEHPPIFTLGLNGKNKHLLNIRDIPVINIDRGGQVTYHAPGQLVIYTLIDLKRLHMSVKDFVNLIENAIIETLANYDIQAEGKENAPGVYVDGAKIAALGLRIKKNRSYHGLSLNIDMNLEPFKQINPCGYENLAVTQVKTYVQNITVKNIQKELINKLSGLLGYKNHSTLKKINP